MAHTMKITLLALLWAGACLAQNDTAKPTADQSKYYRLDFAVKELEGGKAVNVRHYTTTTTASDSSSWTCSIRTGSKVPAPTGSGSSQYTYLDVGVNIDCRMVKEVDGNLALSLTVDVSSVATTSNPPVIRQNKWSSSVIVPIGKPTLVFSSDDVAAKGQMQLEVTATPVR